MCTLQIKVINLSRARKRQSYSKYYEIDFAAQVVGVTIDDLIQFHPKGPEVVNSHKSCPTYQPPWYGLGWIRPGGRD